jgi:aminoglycoside/choline kinase family phosphotransferase
MLHRDRLVVIDFQDARMGPATYDLASLLRDSYVELDQAFVDEMIEYFLRQSGGVQTDFPRRFDLMALQRNLKALGTFGYQVAVANNPVYLEYVPRTLAHVRHNLEQHESRFGNLRDLLAVHLPELR